MSGEEGRKIMEVGPALREGRLFTPHFVCARVEWIGGFLVVEGDAVGVRLLLGLEKKGGNGSTSGNENIVSYREWIEAY